MRAKFEIPFFSYRYCILFAAIAFVYLINMFIDVMEIDAAKYALISMEMSMTKSFFHVFEQGRDYLDKPPLLFWLSSLSFMILGMSNFAYKLPSVLIAILGIYSVYRFSRLWYNKEKAFLAAFILATCQALFLMTNDVRTDTILLGLVMFSVWQLSEYLMQPKLKHLMLSALGIGCAMMAKGPIGLMIPVIAYGSNFLIKKQWENFFKPQWIILLVVVAITLIPMSYGLYTQFDLHPEKTVYGLEGPSGLRFFYWTQSFGRITGESQWVNDTGYFYFMHTILWDFQPWIFLFIPAFILKFKQVWANRKKSENEEYITLGGFVLAFMALSLSKYKLPHYIFVIFPFASIITADFIYQLKNNYYSRISQIQFGIMHLFWILILINFVFFFPPENMILPTVLAGLFALNWLIFLRLKGSLEQLFIPTIITAISFNLLMGLNFYPNVLTYQSSSQAGKMITASRIPKDMFYHYKKSNCALDFYAQRITPSIGLNKIADLKKGSWIYTNKKGLKKLIAHNVPFNTVKVFPAFKVSALKLTFLCKETRDQSLKKNYLIELR